MNHIIFDIAQLYCCIFTLIYCIQKLFKRKRFIIVECLLEDEYFDGTSNNVILTTALRIVKAKTKEEAYCKFIVNTDKYKHTFKKRLDKPLIVKEDQVEVVS